MNLIRNLLELQKVYNHVNISVKVALLDAATWLASGHNCNADATLFYWDRTVADTTLHGERIDIDVESADDGLRFALAHELAHIEQARNNLPFNEWEADKRAADILQEIEKEKE